jgi:SH3-like domain-containing protein
MRPLSMPAFTSRRSFVFAALLTVTLLAAAMTAGLLMPSRTAVSTGENDPGGGRTSLKLPRFASLRAAEVNMRTGPGTRYPVEWVYVQRSLPVEITAEFDVWRKIRDADGTEGWVHQSMLTGRRTIMVRDGIEPLRRDPEAGSPAIARVEPKVIGRLLNCKDAWCRVEIAGLRGWMERKHLFGILPGEKIE